MNEQVREKDENWRWIVEGFARKKHIYCNVKWCFLAMKWRYSHLSFPHELL